MGRVRGRLGGFGIGGGAVGDGSCVQWSVGHEEGRVRVVNVGSIAGGWAPSRLRGLFWIGEVGLAVERGDCAEFKLLGCGSIIGISVKKGKSEVDRTSRPECCIRTGLVGVQKSSPSDLSWSNCFRTAVTSRVAMKAVEC